MHSYIINNLITRLKLKTNIPSFLQGFKVQLSINDIKEETLV